MSKYADIQIKQKQEILTCIAGLSSNPEFNIGGEKFLEGFMPLDCYKRLADPQKFLVIGGYESGKSTLFHLLTKHDGLKYILTENDKKRITDFKESCFIPGYTITEADTDQFPDAKLCSELLTRKRQDKFKIFWLGMTCASILRHYQNDNRISELASKSFEDSLPDILLKEPHKLFMWWDRLKDVPEQAEEFLEEVNQFLIQENKILFLVYDELEKICPEYDGKTSYIAALTNFWHKKNYCFTNLKAKVFLSASIYSSDMFFNKNTNNLSAWCVVLRHDADTMYQILAKRLLNCIGTESCFHEFEFLLKEKREGLGFIPLDNKDALLALSTKIVGPYMGKTPKDGSSYEWLYNRITDTAGNASVKIFLDCFSIAASKMLEHPREIEILERDELISPERLKESLKEAAGIHFQNLTSSEPWLKKLAEKVKTLHRPMGAGDLMYCLSPKSWYKEERKMLPGKTDKDIYESLKSMGIVMELMNGRVLFPAIYENMFGSKQGIGISRYKTLKTSGSVLQKGEKIYLFTHTDLDGIGCAVLAKYAFHDDVLQIEYCDNGEVDEKILRFLSDTTAKGICCITDISMSEKVAELIEADNGKRVEFHLLDHHPTAEFLNRYKWADVVEAHQNGMRTCGTELFYEWLIKNGYLEDKPEIRKFVNLVRDYDTWRWAELGEEGKICKQVNDLFHLYGKEEFITQYISQIRQKTFPYLTLENRAALKAEQKNVDHYVEEKNETITVMKLQGYDCGIVFADRYFSELGDRLATMHPELDIIVMIDMDGKISYRTVRDDINLGEFAKAYGGGGHAKAAGSQFESQKVIKQIRQIIFEDN